MKKNIWILNFLLLLFGCSQSLFSQYSSTGQTGKQTDSLIKLLATAKEDTIKVNNLNALSDHLWKTYNYTEAKKYADDGLSLSGKLNYKKGAADSHDNIGNIYYQQARYTEALKKHLIALKLKEELGDKTSIDNTYNNIGNAYNKLGNYPEALKNCQVALKIREKIEEKSEIASSYYSIGWINFNKGNYPEALKTYLTSLRLYNELGEKSGIAYTYDGIGWIYSRLDNYPEALKNFLASLKIKEKIKDKKGLADSYSNIGSLNSDMGNYPEALKNLKVSLKIREEISDISGIAGSYNNFGWNYYLQGNYPEALKNYLASLKIREEIGDKLGTALALNNLGRLSIKVNKLADAKKYLDRALTLSTEIGSIFHIVDDYNILSKLDSLRGDFKSAYEHHLMYILYRDSLANKENDEKMVRQQMQFDFDKKEDSLRWQQQLSDEKLGQQTLISQQQKQSKNYFIAGLALLAILSFFVYRNFRNKQKLNKLYKVSAEKQMAELQLQSLRAQLNPHFMFNSLNAIQELIVMEENEKSQSYLERFAQLLRQLLENANQPFIPLKKEINFLEHYLSLESLRLPDLKFSIKMDPGFNAENIMIPNMMLQPFIENALWHGLQHKKGDKNLELHIGRENGSVQYEIRDNGVGRKKAEEMKSHYRKEHKSKGMELLAERFDLLSQEYGQNIKTIITDLTENGVASGTLVEISIPASLSNLTQKIYDDSSHYN